MNNIKKIIIILIICMIIIITGIVFLINKRESMEVNNNIDEEITTIELNLKKADNRDMYFSMQSTLNNFFDNINNKNGEIIYASLSQEQIIKDNISKDNILNKIIKVDEFKEFKILEMYTLERVQNYTNYIYGQIVVANNIEKFFCIIDTNMENYIITVINEEEYYNIINNKKGTEKKEIPNNNYNTVIQESISDEKICKIYFNDYMNKVINETDKAYEIINSEYKEERFKDINGFKEYISLNNTILSNSILTKYNIESIEMGDNYEVQNRYILVDNYNNYYTIIENSIMDYEIILDNYTLENTEYDEEYNSLSDNNKVIFNTNKFVKMLNNKDCEHIFELLDDNFKNNKFGNIDKFKEYIINNFFVYNILEIENVETEGRNFIINIKLLSDYSKAAEQINATIIMQLKENTDFVMSFSID